MVHHCFMPEIALFNEALPNATVNVGCTYNLPSKLQGEFNGFVEHYVLFPSVQHISPR